MVANRATPSLIKAVSSPMKNDKYQTLRQEARSGIISLESSQGTPLRHLKYRHIGDATKIASRNFETERKVKVVRKLSPNQSYQSLEPKRPPGKEVPRNPFITIVVPRKIVH